MEKQLNSILIRKTAGDFEQKMQRLRDEHSMSGWLRTNGDIAQRVRDVVGQVARLGDEAVADFTQRFDGVALSAEQFRVGEKELKDAHSALEPKLLAALRRAIENVKKYQNDIFIGNREVQGIRYRPLERVGVCIPGASAPLPSTLIMT